MSMEMRSENGLATFKLGNGLLLVLSETLPKEVASLLLAQVKPEDVCESYLSRREQVSSFVSLNYKSVELIICTHCWPDAPESMEGSRPTFLIRSMELAAGRFTRAAVALQNILENI